MVAFAAAVAALSVLTVATVQGADEAVEGSCPSGQSGGSGDCASESTVAPGLRWRGFPYRITNPVVSKKIYGGNYVKAAFAAAGFDGPEEGDDWDVLWTHKPQSIVIDTLSLPERPRRRLVNHCRYFSAGGDKCNLASYMKRISSADESLIDLATYELAYEKDRAAWKQRVLEQPQQHWVIKPCFAGNSQGIVIKKGQAVLDEAQQHFGQKVVVQEYMERPYMGFGERKFHLRLYLVVTRWSPAAIYLYNDGVIFRSLHKHVADGQRSEALDAFSGISSDTEALHISALAEALGGHGIAASEQAESDFDRAWSRIGLLLRKVLSPEKVAEVFGSFEKLERRRYYSCFELLGADVLLDEELRPALMELNIGPNMWVDDKGKEHEAFLSSVKQPFMEQVTSWVAQRVSGALPDDEARLEAAEKKLLPNFTRIL